MIPLLPYSFLQNHIVSYEILFTAVALSMDACAASVALSSKHRNLVKLFIASTSFGVFQAIMPFLGYLLGIPFEKWIAPIDHWVAFLILSALGLNLFFDFKKENELSEERKLTYGLILSLALATSLDAFVVGIGIHALGWDIGMTVLTIGLVTTMISIFGIFLGRQLQKNFSKFAEKAGGLILILLGVKILMSHLFFS